MSNLIEIEGRYFKECNVVMLPTKDRSEILITNNKLLYKGNRMENSDINQHLYIISDDEIKEGDWCLTPIEEGVQYVIKAKGSNYNKLCKKIIATTDKSLELYTTKGKGVLVTNLPQPSQSFIKAFVKAGGIDKVLVEYEKDIPFGNKYVNLSNIKNSAVITSNLNFEGIKKDFAPKYVRCFKTNKTYSTHYRQDLYPGYYDLMEVKDIFGKIKTDSHNTITIKEVKEKMYSKTELISKIREALTTEDLLDKDERWMGNHLDCVFYNINESNLCNWIKENL